MKFDVYSDPSHGWVKVPRKLLVQLNLDDKISTCSYERGDSVYLEWDDDAPKFIEAMKKKGKTVEPRNHSTDRRSRIRSYSPYTPSTPRVQEPKEQGFAESPVPVHSEPMVDGVVVSIGDSVFTNEKMGLVMGFIHPESGNDHTFLVSFPGQTEYTLVKSSQCSKVFP